MENPEENSSLVSSWLEKANIQLKSIVTNSEKLQTRRANWLWLSEQNEKAVSKIAQMSRSSRRIKAAASGSGSGIQEEKKESPTKVDLNKLLAHLENAYDAYLLGQYESAANICQVAIESLQDLHPLDKQTQILQDRFFLLRCTISLLLAKAQNEKEQIEDFHSSPDPVLAHVSSAAYALGRAMYYDNPEYMILEAWKNKWEKTAEARLHKWHESLKFTLTQEIPMGPTAVDLESDYLPKPSPMDAARTNALTSFSLQTDSDGAPSPSLEEETKVSDFLSDAAVSAPAHPEGDLHVEPAFLASSTTGAADPLAMEDEKSEVQAATASPLSLQPLIPAAVRFPEWHSEYVGGTSSLFTSQTSHGSFSPPRRSIDDEDTPMHTSLPPAHPSATAFRSTLSNP